MPNQTSRATSLNFCFGTGVQVGSLSRQQRHGWSTVSGPQYTDPARRAHTCTTHRPSQVPTPHLVPVCANRVQTEQTTIPRADERRELGDQAGRKAHVGYDGPDCEPGHPERTLQVKFNSSREGASTPQHPHVAQATNVFSPNLVTPRIDLGAVYPCTGFAVVTSWQVRLNVALLGFFCAAVVDHAFLCIL